MISIKRPAREHTRLVLASSFVRPDPSWPLSALLLLRDADAAVVDPAAARVRFASEGAAQAKGERLGPGLWQLTVAAPADAGGKILALRVFVDDQLVAARDVRVAVDPSVARAGFSARGGCAIGGRPATPAGAFWVGLVALWGLCSFRSASRRSAWCRSRAACGARIRPRGAEWRRARSPDCSEDLASSRPPGRRRRR